MEEDADERHHVDGCCNTTCKMLVDQSAYTSDVEIQLFKCDLFINEVLSAAQELIKTTGITLSRLDRLNEITHEQQDKIIERSADVVLAAPVVEDSKV